jgi:hypothetical protein
MYVSMKVVLKSFVVIFMCVEHNIDTIHILSIWRQRIHMDGRKLLLLRLLLSRACE